MDWSGIMLAWPFRIIIPEKHAKLYRIAAEWMEMCSDMAEALVAKLLIESLIRTFCPSNFRIFWRNKYEISPMKSGWFCCLLTRNNLKNIQFRLVSQCYTTPPSPPAKENSRFNFDVHNRDGGIQKCVPWFQEGWNRSWIYR